MDAVRAGLDAAWAGMDAIRPGVDAARARWTGPGRVPPASWTLPTFLPFPGPAETLGSSGGLVWLPPD